MKFELTAETKEVFGVKLFRIKALVAFCNIKSGDLGGWVEKIENIDQSGDAWVYGNAWVYGDAQVYGNAQVSPINLIGLKYNITIIDNHIQIGCEYHTFEEWFNFDDRQILEMDGKQALEWWKVYKPVLQSIVGDMR